MKTLSELTEQLYPSNETDTTYARGAYDHLFLFVSEYMRRSLVAETHLPQRGGVGEVPVLACKAMELFIPFYKHARARRETPEIALFVLENEYNRLIREPQLNGYERTSLTLMKQLLSCMPAYDTKTVRQLAGYLCGMALPEVERNLVQVEEYLPIDKETGRPRYSAYTDFSFIRPNYLLKNGIPGVGENDTPELSVTVSDDLRVYHIIPTETGIAFQVTPGAEPTSKDGKERPLHAPIFPHTMYIFGHADTLLRAIRECRYLEQENEHILGLYTLRKPTGDEIHCISQRVSTSSDAIRQHQNRQLPPGNGSSAIFFTTADGSGKAVPLSFCLNSIDEQLIPPLAQTPF